MKTPSSPLLVIIVLTVVTIVHIWAAHMARQRYKEVKRQADLALDAADVWAKVSGRWEEAAHHWEQIATNCVEDFKRLQDLH